RGWSKRAVCRSLRGARGTVRAVSESVVSWLGTSSAPGARDVSGSASAGVVALSAGAGSADAAHPRAGAHAQRATLIPASRSGGHAWESNPPRTLTPDRRI